MLVKHNFWNPCCSGDPGSRSGPAGRSREIFRAISFIFFVLPAVDTAFYSHSQISKYGKISIYWVEMSRQELAEFQIWFRNKIISEPFSGIHKVQDVWKILPDHFVCKYFFFYVRITFKVYFPKPCTNVKMDECYCVCIFVCMYVCTYVCICIYVFMYVTMQARIQDFTQGD